MWGFSESTETDLWPGASPVFIAACVHELQALESHQFQGFKLDPAFTAFSHDDGSSNSGLDGFVDSWPPEIHISWRIARSHTAWNRWCPNLHSDTALSLYDSRITPIIITDITGRCNVRIQIPYTCTTSSGLVKRREDMTSRRSNYLDALITFQGQESRMQFTRMALWTKSRWALCVFY